MVCLNCYIEFSQPAFLIFRYSVYRLIAVRFCSLCPWALTPLTASRKTLILGAGWSSPVARQAHNLKAAGSNPAPATNPYLPIFLLTY